MLTQNLEDMGYKSSIADPDVFMRTATKPNGDEYYEFLLTYGDDCLCVSVRPEDTMDILGKIYDLKDTVKPLECYLGANIKRWQLHKTVAAAGWPRMLGNVWKRLRQECRIVMQGNACR
jgi:hypothetical protein